MKFRRQARGYRGPKVKLYDFSVTNLAKKNTKVKFRHQARRYRGHNVHFFKSFFLKKNREIGTVKQSAKNYQKI